MQQIAQTNSEYPFQASCVASFIRKCANLAIFDHKTGKNRLDRIRNVPYNGPRYSRDGILALQKRSSSLGDSYGAAEGAVPHLGFGMDPAHGVLRLGSI